MKKTSFLIICSFVILISGAAISTGSEVEKIRAAISANAEKLKQFEQSLVEAQKNSEILEEDLDEAESTGGDSLELYESTKKKLIELQQKMILDPELEIPFDEGQNDYLKAYQGWKKHEDLKVSLREKVQLNKEKIENLKNQIDDAKGSDAAAKNDLVIVWFYDFQAAMEQRIDLEVLGKIENCGVLSIPVCKSKAMEVAKSNGINQAVTILFNNVKNIDPSGMEREELIQKLDAEVKKIEIVNRGFIGDSGFFYKVKLGLMGQLKPEFTVNSLLKIDEPPVVPAKTAESSTEEDSADAEGEKEITAEDDENMETETAAVTPKKNDNVWKDPVMGMEFVRVKDGCFQMGCGFWSSDCMDSELPTHEVCLDAFFMGRFEVTQKQWKEFMGVNPADVQKGDNYPVEMVSWDEANIFIDLLNEKNNNEFTFRLPTEAEWEYACRSGGMLQKYCGGNDLEQVGWFRNNSELFTHPVGAKKPNGLGIYDMSGNVYEWVQDWHGFYPDVEKQGGKPRVMKNPKGPFAGALKVFRGGSWNNYPQFCRSAQRSGSAPRNKGRLVGFRVVRDVIVK
jgi:formylglycine-generating enzyme required for sulfatase activity